MTTPFLRTFDCN